MIPRQNTVAKMSLENALYVMDEGSVIFGKTEAYILKLLCASLFCLTSLDVRIYDN